MAWAFGFVLVASVIVGTGFTSEDPDSTLHAGIAARLSAEPVSRWVAPEWWGFWPEAQLTGLYVEHPAGVFILPAALGRLGLPVEQAAYVVGIGAGLLALLLLASVVGTITDSPEARATMVLVQLMPVAFIFRIRANHEYLMLVCLLLTILGLQRVGRSWSWTCAVAAGLVGGLLVKGAFVSLILLAAGLWVVIGPAGNRGERRRASIALGVGLLAMAAAAAAYDALYVNATGHPFWMAYWTRQIGPLTETSPMGDLPAIAGRFVFYVSRLLWHPAPWSLALIWVGWRHRAVVRDLEPTVRQAAMFAMAFAGLAILMLSLSSRLAERYAFSPVFVVGALGAVVSYRWWPGLRAALLRADGTVPWFPAALWTALALLRLVVGPVLPRI